VLVLGALACAGCKGDPKSPEYWDKQLGSAHKIKEKLRVLDDLRESGALTPAFLPVLHSHLSQDKQSEVRGAIARMLGEMKDPSSVDPLSDALEMGSIVKNYGSGEASVRALEAGADVLLMPSDPDAAIRGVVAAVDSGRISRLRVQESVVRILEAKERAGLDRKSFVNLEGISDAVNSPEANDKAEEVADRAVTLVRNAPGLVPAAAADHACFLVLSEGRYSADGQVFAEELRKRLPQAALATLDPSMSREVASEALSRLPECENYVVAAYSSFVAYRGTLSLGGELPRAVEGLIASGKPVTLIALGSPYLLRDFPGVAAYLATFSIAPTAEAAAVRALFGEIPIQGHLPVTIPGLAQLGDGIQLDAKRAHTENGDVQ